MRGEYSTRQKRELLKFLKEHELENFSLDEVVLRLRERGASVGRSTAYRYLEALAEQGSVRKYAGAQGITQYQSVAEEGDCSRHFHMLCKRCGTLQHVDCALMESLARHVAEHHGFRLDARETMLVGVCARCARLDELEGQARAEREDRGEEGQANGDGADTIDGRHDCL